MLSALFALVLRLLVGVATLILTALSIPVSSGQASLHLPTTSVGGSAVSAQADLSRNWAGYQATRGSFTSVTGTWTVPHLSSDGQVGADAAWVGIGGVESRDLIQGGTQAIVSPSGRVSYSAFVETLPSASRPIPVAVNEGDSVTVSIVEQGTNQWQITFTDNTSGQSYQTTKTYRSSLSSAEWIEEAPSAGRGVLPLDNFGKVSFTNGFTTENGKRVSMAQAGAQPINMVNIGRQTLATPSALGTDGASFTVTRSDAASYPAGMGSGSGFGPGGSSPLPRSRRGGYGYWSR